ncbi:MAG: hypothetical protein NT027_13850 [Proteobacteria bacterium]|nr:hypothetical protein [Pseudomonadota bacterium]
MKHMMSATLSVFALAVSANAFAAKIESGRYNAATKAIELDVAYGGGCGEHQFTLDVGACAESMPVQCRAKLIHKTDDTCEAYIMKTISISLKSAKLDSEYYADAFLTITGDQNSSVSLQLMEESKAKAVETSIEVLSTLSFDGQTLDVAYSIGGGCAEHNADIRVKVAKIASGAVAAVVSVVDIASDQDPCEALLFVTKKVNLREMILIAAKSAGISDAQDRAIKVTLPEVSVSGN